MEPETLCGRRLAHGFYGIVDHLVQIDRLHLQMEFAGDDSTHVEQIIDDLYLHPYVALDCFRTPPLVLGTQFRLLQ